jgi:hypothetical protein
MPETGGARNKAERDEIRNLVSHLIAGYGKRIGE